jgi:hypothetical protein
MAGAGVAADGEADVVFFAMRLPILRHSRHSNYNRSTVSNREISLKALRSRKRTLVAGPPFRT